VRFYHGFATAIFVPVTGKLQLLNDTLPRGGNAISAFNSATAVGRGLAPFWAAPYCSLLTTVFTLCIWQSASAGSVSFVIALLVLSENKMSIAQSMKAKVATGRMLSGWLVIARNKGALVVSFVQSIQYYVYGVVEFLFGSVYDTNSWF